MTTQVMNERNSALLQSLLVTLLVTMAVGSVLIMLFGQSPLAVYKLLLSSTWGSSHGIGQTLFKTTPLLFTGFAVAIAFRAGLFNIGCEGQLMIASFACAVACAALPSSTSAALALPFALLVAMLAGGVWGAIPGVLRAYSGAHEVISTIMLNFVAGSVVLYFGNRYFFVTETTHTAPIAPGSELGTLGLGASNANYSFLIALVVAVLFYLFIRHTRAGFELRTLGSSPRAAENAGISITRRTVLAMTLSGAIAGLVAGNYVLGYKHYFEDGMGRGTGFMGIAVALLGRNHPLGIVAAALLFGTLSSGGLEVNKLVPKELVEVLQAVIIAVVAVMLARQQARSSR